MLRKVTLEFYLANADLYGESWSFNPAEIHIAKYKELLWNLVDEILEIAGIDIVALKKEFGVKTIHYKPKCKRKDKHSKDYDTEVHEKNDHASIGGAQPSG